MVRFLGRQQLPLQQYWEVVDVGDRVFGICGVGHSVHRRGRRWLSCAKIEIKAQGQH